MFVGGRREKNARGLDLNVGIHVLKWASSPTVRRVSKRQANPSKQKKGTIVNAALQYYPCANTWKCLRWGWGQSNKRVTTCCIVILNRCVMIQLKLSKISKQITYSSALSCSWVAAFFVESGSGQGGRKRRAMKKLILEFKFERVFTPPQRRQTHHTTWRPLSLTSRMEYLFWWMHLNSSPIRIFLNAPKMGYRTWFLSSLYESASCTIVHQWGTT